MEKGKMKAHVADRLLFRHWDAWEDGKRTHVLLLDLADAKAPLRDLTPGDFDSPAFSVGGGADFDVSPDGKELVFTSNRDAQPATSTNSDLWVVPIDGTPEALAAPRNLTAANRAFDGSPRYSPDGRSIAYRMQRVPGYESDRSVLAIYDRASGTSRVVTEALRRLGERLPVRSRRKADPLHGGREGPDAAARPRPREREDLGRLQRRPRRRLRGLARRDVGRRRAAPDAPADRASPRRALRAGVGTESAAHAARTRPSSTRWTSAPWRRSSSTARAGGRSRSSWSSRTASTPRRSTRPSSTSTGARRCSGPTRSAATRRSTPAPATSSPSPTRTARPAGGRTSPPRSRATGTAR